MHSRINQIKESGSVLEQVEKELRYAIEEGDKMSEENSKLFDSLLS